eukprot:GHVS01100060.1.p1 GENE.GHVS01100060.1~~GHVS01100060.1.p1  ORF type:complete len:217 (-),score=19.18 GHVS01100060.1:161-811(-)
MATINSTLAILDTRHLPDGYLSDMASFKKTTMDPTSPLGLILPLRLIIHIVDMILRSNGEVSIETKPSRENSTEHNTDMVLSDIEHEWDFAAMFDGIACNRKRTAEALFEGPWESIEKYSKGVYSEEDEVTFIIPSATASLKTPVLARLWNHSACRTVDCGGALCDSLHPVAEGYLQKGKGLEFLLKSKISAACWRVICELDESFGWNCPKWEKCD